MLIPRVIPVLLLQDGAIVKTTKFKNPSYIGDPINTVNLYNQFSVDELIILDIDATRKNTKPNFAIIEEICSQIFMPLTYGGGVNNIEDMQLLYRLGVEKIVLGKAAHCNPNLVRTAAEKFGNQAIVASVDYRESILGKRRVFVQNGRIKINSSMREYINGLIDLGVGEILMHAIDRDGTMNGYDHETIHSFSAAMPVPLVALGGARSKSCISKVIHNSNAQAAAASSIFIYQNQAKGVLINFPDSNELNQLLSKEALHEITE